jgi:hypothetical protein
MNGLIAWLDGMFAKLPVLPDNIRAGMRRYLPWIIAIASGLLLVSLAAALGILSVGFALLPVTYIGTGALWKLDLYVLTPLGAVLGLLGGIGMIRGKAKGWELAVYSELVFALSGIVTMSLGSVLMHLIGLWMLFQIRSLVEAEQTPAP